MGLRNYVLKNNEKPATHFIEVILLHGHNVVNDICLPIDELKEQLEETEFIDAKTIALFKIRLK